MTIRGVVVEGKKLGRKLGFPTANILISEELCVKNGVYRSRTMIEGEWMASVTNVGHNPTTGVESRRVESYILDFEGNIYGQTITVELVEMIREEQKFENIEALRTQVKADIERVRAMCRPHKA
ncbi:MAG: riboflavin kinase [Rikenellaceae bacterium]